ncbi:MAG TPA: hypothetical protein VF601_11005 [Beijerinckiaceae bacterium]|jgi:hypothetical protein
MSIPEIAGLDPNQAAGLLARMALSVDSGGLNPDAAPVLPGEEEFRARLTEWLRSELHNEGVKDQDLRARILDWLDREAERVSAPADEAAALDRLSADAVLPSDAYTVLFEDDIEEFVSKMGFDDRPLVDKVLRSPEFEQHFGPPRESDDQPSLVSLFAKWFNEDDQKERFLFIVVGNREKNVFHVRHFWRVYPNEVVVAGARSLVEVFERFTGVYGLPFSVEGWRGRFLYNKVVTALEKDKLTVGTGTRPNSRGVTVIVAQKRDNLYHLAFGMNVDLSSYSKDVLRHIRRATIKARRGEEPHH